MRIPLTEKKLQNVFVSFLHLLGVKYTDVFSNKYFNEHPHKYSLYGLSKMLSEYNVENAAIKIQNKKEGLSELEAPFIAYTASDFVVVKEITPERIHYLWNGKEIKISHQDFFQLWTGVVLLAEPDESSKEPGFEKHIEEERISSLKKVGLFLLSILLLLILYINQTVLHSNIGLTILLLANIAGIYIGYLLVQKQMKVQSNYADKICSLFKQSDCNNILESDASKLFGILSWSEVGLGYFIANACIMLLFPYLISYLAIINICTLPYTIWSIWYQRFNAKQWCLLCIIVQGLLWIVFIINLVSGFILFPSFEIKDVLMTGCIYAIPVLIANLLISMLSQSENVEQIKQEINSIKATDEVFVSLLKKQPHYDVAKNTSQILFGNPDADILVTVLTNPHCNPCSKMHKRVESILAEGNDNLCVQYIFSSFEDSLDSSNQFLIAAYINRPEDRGRIISTWFDSGKNEKETFFKLYDLNKAEEVMTEFNKHEAWKQETGLRATPTILVNGYKLPDNYKIEDLKYFTILDL